MCRMNVVKSTCAGQLIYHNTQLVVRCAGMWPSLRSAEKPANMPVASLAANHSHFNVQNPTADSIAWSREASLNTIPAIDVTIYTSRHQRITGHFLRPPSDRQ